MKTDEQLKEFCRRFGTNGMSILDEHDREVTLTVRELIEEVLESREYYRNSYEGNL